MDGKLSVFGTDNLAGVISPGPGEPLDDVLHRFRREVEESGVLREHRRHQHFVSPSELRRRSKERRRKRLAKRVNIR